MKAPIFTNPLLPQQILLSRKYSLYSAPSQNSLENSGAGLPGVSRKCVIS